MPARRFFVEGVRATGASVEIDGSDARKILRVLRLTDGDAVEIVDSAGTLFDAVIDISGSVVTAMLAGRVPDECRAGETEIDLAQAVPKGAKMDFIVEKTVELGVRAIVPFYCERSVVRDAGTAKLERWQRVAKTAAQQCGRRSLPAICPALPTFDALLERFERYDAVLVAWELAPQVPLLRRLSGVLTGAARIAIVIGPEGGFSHEEAERARGSGAALLWLGRQILRTETAAMALLAVVNAVTQSRA